MHDTVAPSAAMLNMRTVMRGGFANGVSTFDCQHDGENAGSDLEVSRIQRSIFHRLIVIIDLPENTVILNGEVVAIVLLVRIVGR